MITYQENLIMAKSLIRSNRAKALKHISTAICLEPRRAEPFYLLSIYCCQGREWRRAQTAYSVARELEGLSEC